MALFGNANLLQTYAFLCRDFCSLNKQPEGFRLISISFGGSSSLQASPWLTEAVAYLGFVPNFLVSHNSGPHGPTA